MIEKKLISIHLNSNNPENFEKLILSLVKNTENIELVEIIVSIDLGDKSMKDTIKKFNRKYSNFINYIETDLIKTFADAWKPLNLLLEETSSTVKEQWKNHDFEPLRGLSQESRCMHIFSSTLHGHAPLVLEKQKFLSTPPCKHSRRPRAV